MNKLRTERVSRTGLTVTPARNEPPAPPMNSTEHKAGSQFSPIRSVTICSGSGILPSTGWRSPSSSKYAASSPVVETISNLRPGHAFFASIFSIIDSGSVTSVPPQPLPGSATWK